MENLPLGIDLFCGLGGWTDGLLAEGYRVVGYDIERHDYGDGKRYPAELVIQDVLTIHGSSFKDASLIVASPPCQEYSYMAMPWGKAKALAKEYRSGKRDVKKLTALFDACFRIQREAIEAAGRFIPMVVENVRGAQPWVGRARWNFGSYYLWGDVPALMPITLRGVRKTPVGSWDKTRRNYNPNHSWEGCKIPGFRFGGNGKSFQSEAVKVTGLDWSAFGKPGYKAQGFNVGAQRFRASDDGVKGFTPEGQPLGKNELGRKFGSKSDSRKAASAQIAKIPFPLAQWIARTWKPSTQPALA